jgi:multiple sugar transport system permease protein
VAFKQSKYLQFLDKHYGSVMIAPAIIFTVLMIAFPLVYAVFLSFQEFSFGQLPAFIGLENFRMLFDDPVFWNGFRITAILFFGGMVVELIAGLYIAVLLDQEIKAIRWLRTLLMTPFVMPAVVIGMIWLVMLDPSIGFVNYVLESIGLEKSLWLSSPTLVLPTFILIDAWQWTPLVALILLGGLRSLPKEPHEAALADGATPVQIFRYVTLPLLRPTIFVAAMIRSIDLLRIFDTIYVTTEGGPGYSSTSLNIYAFKRGFDYFEMGYASSIMLSLLVLVVAVNIILVSTKKGFQ